MAGWNISNSRAQEYSSIGQDSERATSASMLLGEDPAVPYATSTSTNSTTYHRSDFRSHTVPQQSHSLRSMPLPAGLLSTSHSPSQPSSTRAALNSRPLVDVPDSLDPSRYSPTQHAMSSRNSQVSGAQLQQRLSMVQQQQHQQRGMVGMALPLPSISAGQDSSNSLVAYQDHATGALAPHVVATLQANAVHHDEAARFMDELMATTTNADSLDKYRSFIKLMSSLKRQVLALGLRPRDDPIAWVCSPEGLAVLKRIVKVGEALARFGTNDFRSNGSNGARAIDAKDYGVLLDEFMKRFSVPFCDNFLEVMPLDLQDEAAAVRLMLRARCETNTLIFDKYMERVGTESRAVAAPAMVTTMNMINTRADSSVKHNPKIQLQSLVHALSQSKIMQNSSFAKIAMGVAGAGALWLLKGRLLGRRGASGRRGNRDDESYEFDDGAGRRRQRAARRSGGAKEAVARVDDCRKEFEKARRNEERIRNMGVVLPLGFRFVMPADTVEGYETTDGNKCDVRAALEAL